MTTTRRLRSALLAGLFAALLPAAVQAGWLGITISDLVGSEQEHAVRIQKVLPDGPAARAGLRPGDRILGIEGHPTKACSEVASIIQRTPASEEVRLRIRRDGRELTVPVMLGERPEGAPDSHVEIMKPPLPPLVLQGDRNRMVRRPWLGIEIMPLTGGLADYLEVERGVLVSRVADGGPAEKAGIRAGDVIVTVQGEPVERVSDLQDRIRRTKAGEPLPMRAVRDGEKIAFDPVLVERETRALFFGLAPDNAGWVGSFDAETWRESMEKYKQALQEHMEGSRDAEAMARKLQELAEAAELLSRDEALQQLLEERTRTVTPAPDGSGSCRRELAQQERKIRDLERRLEEREHRLRTLEQRLAVLERSRN